MPSAEELLKQMGIDPEEIDKNWDRRGAWDPEARLICSCGHGKGRHVIEPDFVTCNPSKLNCPCGNFVPVLKVQDTRSFLSRTQGSGIDHALIKGLRIAMEKNQETEWIDDHYKCFLCGTKGYETALTITALEGQPETGLRKSNDAEFARYNGFLCETCWDQV